MGKKKIFEPHESERLTLHLWKFKSDALINAEKILSLTQERRRYNGPDKDEDIPQLHGRHLSN